MLLWVCKCFYYKIDIGLFLVSCKKLIDHHGSQKVKEVHCTYNKNPKITEWSLDQIEYGEKKEFEIYTSYQNWLQFW